MKLNLKIDGMACEHCIKSVKQGLEEVEGVKVLDVKIGSAEVEVENENTLDKIKEKLDDIGYDFV